MQLWIIATASLVVLFGTPALAADLPLPTKAPPPAPVLSWTGFYLGIEGGVDWSTSTVIHGPNDPFIATGITTPLTNPIRATSGLGGLTSGYNYQIGQIVIGYESDSSITNLTGSAQLLAPHFNPVNLRTVSVGDISTFRGRIGWLPTPTWLVYATGGAALAGEQFNWISPPTTVQSASQFVWGYAVGGGVEWKMDNRISVKAEYLHIGLSTFEFDNIAMVGGAGFFTTDNLVRPTIDIVRVGVNLKIESSPAFLPSLLPTN
jgi:outer membrane immunogenic protein